MARRPRLELAGVPLHVIQRGNNRMPCFIADGDRHIYLKYLCVAAQRHKCAIHAYVLMPNHVHLLATPATSGAIAAMMQDLGRRYVRVFNDIHERTGTLWEGRYKAAMVDTDRYLIACQRYIELNPVRAGLVRHPVEYRWSSHRHYALGTDNALITPHCLIESLAFDGPARRQAYAALFETPVEPQIIEQIRENTNKGWPLGPENFIQRVEAGCGRPGKAPKRGRPRKALPSESDESDQMLI